MQQVASALKNHAANRPLAARPPQAADRAPAAPFASLLDDSAPAPERPPQSSANDHGIRAARSDQTPQPAKSTDSKAAKAKDDAGSANAGKDAKNDAKNDPKTGKADKTDQTASDGKAAADAETIDKTGQPTDGKDATPTSDGKPTDALIIGDAAIAPPADAMPTITTAETTATVLPPTVLPPAVIPPAADNVATVATPATPAIPAIPGALADLQAGTTKAAADNAATPAIPAIPAKPAKPGALADLQAGTTNDAADQAPTVKTAAQPHGEAKPQGPASDAANKDNFAHARGELAETTHHAAAAQAPGTIATDAMAATPQPGAEAMQPTAPTAPPQTTAPAGPNLTASAPMPQPAAILLAGVAIEIAGKALAGKNHFEIRLDPPELGRIEVRLNIDRDGNVTSRMIADRADTLDLLRRDAGSLERALQDAGLKTSDNGLQFSLRDQSTQQQARRDSDIARLVVEDELLPEIDAAPRSYSRLAGLGSGIDIHV